MSNLWIVVTDSALARVYSKIGGEPGLELVREFWTSVESANDPRQYRAQRFARDLSALLEFGAMQKSYSQMVIAASPDFLGVLRLSLGPATRERLVCLLDSDLTRSRMDDLEGQLGDALNVLPAGGPAAQN